ncbi:bacillithiol biosynthesis cysteine-adding enzyme BshC [Ornithinibacillus sp. BX22]|uniref:Putative cysteine ligase BshC n=1 Tax=Ornithinibacillus hominis TaxID=2763055 RepID=A0A923L3L9_9BACI|nr:bacillithiol biosynthesis cysteine-adding enzyme BshC [Ornithinibacillus hominis]MBC5635865.1 bacillithiol biosynthesis cysteine-adding enzyme BshC [Ornithinibacillus hominis]
MRIEPVQIQKQTKLMRDYRNQHKSILEFFDYGMNDYASRLQELKQRTYKREELVEVLYHLNQSWGAPEKTFRNIERLKDDQSVVVVGGQQAGVLTGPLYSVNKVISIIQLARQQEKDLGIPVVPLFWIAGEDHDFEEVNHIYLQVKNMMKKFKVGQRLLDKRSVSKIELEEPIILDWLESIFEQLAETEHTKDIYSLIVDSLHKSTTYVDFFARLIFLLFEEDGIVLMDSGNEKIRRLESDYFVEMITKQQEISDGVCHAYKQLTSNDYSIALDVAPENGNLFYHKDEERILLTKNQEGNWVGKQLEVIFTTDELMEMAKKTPEKLSNNVVTRPLMQDLLLPTLAFIGGPGEISYWAVLKPAFHAMEMKMPPVVPRLSFTYMDRKTEKTLNKYHISSALALNGEISGIRKAWFKEKVNPPIEETVEELKKKITEAHEPLRTIAHQVRADIRDLAEKNLDYLIRDVAYLEKRMVRALEEQYHKELNEFTLLENMLYPGGLQERVWNPLPFINAYGLHFFQEISAEDCSFEEEHYVVYI